MWGADAREVPIRISFMIQAADWTRSFLVYGHHQDPSAFRISRSCVLIALVASLRWAPRGCLRHSASFALSSSRVGGGGGSGGFEFIV